TQSALVSPPAEAGAAPRGAPAAPPPPAEAGQGKGGGGAKEGKEAPPPAVSTNNGEIVLYRCPTRTNFLCPCGAVARRLKGLGLDYRTERVPYRRRARPEIAELTRQRRVPVLVDGDEIVHDSRRIIQWLEHAHGSDERARGWG